MTGEVLIDASGSDYFVGINVFAGSADPAFLYTCFGPAGSVFLEAGVTYYLMFADADQDVTNGGSLHVVLDVPPRPIEVELTIDPTGRVDRNGNVTITGSLTCDRVADFAQVAFELSQTIGRFRIHGWGFTESTWSTSPTSWVAVLSGENGTFGSGKASVMAFADACDAFTCSSAFADARMRLRR